MTEPNHSIRLTMPSDYDALPLVRHVIRQLLEPLPDPAESLYLGAVTEILVNAIDATQAPTIDVIILIRPEPAIIISNAATGFNPANPTSTKPGSLGQGLAIARTVVPGLKITQTEHSTSVTLPYPQPSETTK